MTTNSTMTRRTAGEQATLQTEHPLTWRRTPALAIGSIAALSIVVAGLVFSRPDVVALATPLAVWCALVLMRLQKGALALTLAADAADDAAIVDGVIGISSDADWVQLAVDQSESRRGYADTGTSEAAVRTRSRLRHSGPIELVGVVARAVEGDGAWVSVPTSRARLGWNAAPTSIALGPLPVAPRLRGLHGSHRGARQGQGGDFRDIHAFVPGDELRRVDWRATARLARRPGDLLVRRTDTLSEASVVIAMDTADDLGTVVATWGSPDPERSGITSLDLARQAALSLSTAAIGAGDRVSFHELAAGGRTVLPGAGIRHLARVRSAVAATGVSGDVTRYRRTPPVPQGSVIFVLSTFFDRAVTELALRWRASGHRVVAVDVLPPPDATRLSGEQRIALRTLTAEHEDALADLRHAGADVVAWQPEGAGADAVLRAAARVRA